VEFDFAPFGILGLETELALSLTELYHAGHLPLRRVVECFTARPAALLPRLTDEQGHRLGRLEVGGPADVTLIDPEQEWVYDVRQTASKSVNSPFHGWRLKGRAVATLCRGEVVWSAREGLTAGTGATGGQAAVGRPGGAP
jgi:dihydroorotase